MESIFVRIIVKFCLIDKIISFQFLARFLFTLNILLPTFSHIFVMYHKPYELNTCLGKGYLNYFIPYQYESCPYENWFSYIFCGSIQTLLYICMSNVIDAFCVYYCVQEIKTSTEETKNMLSKQAYVNRRRYTPKIKYSPPCS